MNNIDKLTFNLEMILTAVYDEDGNDVSNKYINWKMKDLDEMKEDNDENAACDYKWIITNLELEIFGSPFFEYCEDEIKFKIELDLRKDDGSDDEIYVILKSMPLHLKQLSLKCDIKIEEINVSISGIVHFKQCKLRAKLIDIVFDLEDLTELTILTNISVIAKYQ